MTLLANKKRIIIGSVSSITLLMLSSCSSSNTILDEDYAMREQTHIELISQKIPNQTHYQSNLKTFSYPNKNTLIQEANFKNHKEMEKSVSLLSDWISHNMSQRNRSKLARNCELLVGKYNDQFPLNELTLACSAWWLDTRSSFRNKTGSADSKSYQVDNFKHVLARVDVNSVSQANNLVTTALKNTSNCSYKNNNAALIFKLEKLLPNSFAYNNIDSIYSGMQTCLKPNEEPTEKLHLRAGLLYLIHGKTGLAKQALEKTQLETDPQENSRNLFWLGAIYHKENPSRKTENPYWKKLIHDYPISFAAIVACQQMGIDPASVVVPDEQIPMQNRIAGGWNKSNLEAFVFEFLNASKERNAANIWASSVARTTQTTDPSMLLYWALIENRQRNYFNSILLLGKYTKYAKNYQASPTLLRLQFPMPYLHEIANTSSDVDPVFMLALIRQESAFSEHARSGANARGLMQVLPSTARMMKKSIRPDDLYDPRTNMVIGRMYLERLLRKYDGKIETVLAAYNAGDLNADRWSSRVPTSNTMLFSDYIPFQETRNYVSIILRNYYWYNRLLRENNDSFSKVILEKSAEARWKSEKIEALLAFSENKKLNSRQEALFDKLYLFGSAPSPAFDVNISQKTPLKTSKQ